jgi:hypothetical protein
MNHFEKQSEYKRYLIQKRKEKLVEQIGWTLLIALIAFGVIYFGWHLDTYLMNTPEIPTIDGVQIRNEAQMYGGYREL